MSRLILAVVFLVSALLLGCGQEGDFPIESEMDSFEEVTQFDESEAALRIQAADLCSGEDCTSHQGCFYVNRYANWPDRDPKGWTYHARNCVVFSGKCTCPAITPWSIVLNTCKNICIDDADEVEPHDEAVPESRENRRSAPR